uniref:Tail assembly chaperone n=2 Tax=unclassified bacterial viruses TaxID=12333 RepID=A0AAU7J7Y6_9VIRU
MYNMAFGPTHQKIPAIAACGVDPERVGRYRDVWMEKDESDLDSLVLAIYTRNGGGNREDQADAIEYMQAHPRFISDADDTFDNTYATFRFRVRIEDLDLDTLSDLVPPEQMLSREATWAGLNLASVDPMDTDARWRQAIDALNGAQS